MFETIPSWFHTMELWDKFVCYVETEVFFVNKVIVCISRLVSNLIHVIAKMTQCCCIQPEHRGRNKRPLI